METDINVIRNEIQYDKKVNSTSSKNTKKYKLFKINTNNIVERNRNIKSAIKTYRYNIILYYSNSNLKYRFRA